MRALGMLGLLLLLAGCVSDPKSLGITGPGARSVPQPEEDTGNSYQMGSPQTGMGYSNSYGQSTGPSGFWGYNQ